MHSSSVLRAEFLFTTMLVIFVSGTVVTKVASKLRVPDVVLFIIIGILLGPSVLGVVNIGSDSIVNQVIVLFGASFILLHGGIITRLSVLRRVWRSIALLSTLGVLITAFVVAIAAQWILGTPFLISLLLGSVIASTDPAALVPIFQRFPVEKKVAQTVISESAFTDATGAILTTVVLGLALSQSSVSGWNIAMQFVQLSLGGVIVGTVVGGCAAFLVSENDRGLLREFTPMVIVITVLASYIGAEWMHASGFMSVFVAGIMLGNADSYGLTILPDQDHAMHEFMDSIGLKVRMLVFVLLGSQVRFDVLREYAIPAILIVLIFMLIARPMTVIGSLLPDRKAKWTRNEVLFFFWTRETGVIAAALAGILVSSGLKEGELIQSVTFVAILMTLIIQASTTSFVAKLLKLLRT